MVSLREFHLLGNGMGKLKLSKVDKNIPSDNTCAEALHQEGASCLPPLEAGVVGARRPRNTPHPSPPSPVTPLFSGTGEGPELRRHSRMW